jgi:hypothetical protein
VTRRFATLCALATCPTFICIAGIAHAGNDAEALKLDQDAVYQDYLNLDFAAAQKKLSKAIELCQTECRPETKARVLRDMGVIYVAGTQQRADGVAKFAEALAINPSLTLDADLSTPELEAAFAEAKGSASASGDPALDAAMRGSVKPDEEEPLPPPVEDPSAEPVLTESPEEPKPVEPKPEPKPEVAHSRPVETDAEDCPPDFPGCNSVDNSGDEDEESDGGELRHWLSASFQVDFLLLSAAQAVCAGVEYQCFRGPVYSDPSTAGFDSPDDMSTTKVGAGDVKSGIAIGTMRALLGYDFAIIPEILLGARAGFAFGGGPERGGVGSKKFQPVHAELRAAYWFTSVKEGAVRPFIELSGGLAEVDARVKAKVIDLGQGQMNVCANNSDPTCLVVEADAWRKTGIGFVGAGLGAMFAFGDNHGIVVEGRGMQMLGASATALGANIGYSFGL